MNRELERWLDDSAWVDESTPPAGGPDVYGYGDSMRWSPTVRVYDWALDGGVWPAEKPGFRSATRAVMSGYDDLAVRARRVFGDLRAVCWALRGVR